jgi:hypothetical protein
VAAISKAANVAGRNLDIGSISISPTMVSPPPTLGTSPVM